MTEYKHTMTIIVPEVLMISANQLALIAGESADDVNTFIQANWQDIDGNLYSVCSTVIKPIVLTLLTTPLADSELQADGADIEQAQQVMDKVLIYEQGMKATPDHIYIAIDTDDLYDFFDLMGIQIIDNGTI